MDDVDRQHPAKNPNFGTVFAGGPRSQLYKPELKMIKRLVGHQLIQQNRCPGSDFQRNPSCLFGSNRCAEYMLDEAGIYLDL